MLLLENCECSMAQVKQRWFFSSSKSEECDLKLCRKLENYNPQNQSRSDTFSFVFLIQIEQPVGYRKQKSVHDVLWRRNGDISVTHNTELTFCLEQYLESRIYTNSRFYFLFQGIIDYIFYSKPQLNILGILGPLDHHWLIENNISGCPHPLIPSDHFSLFAQLELLLPFLPPVNGMHLPGRRQSSTLERATSV